LEQPPLDAAGEAPVIDADGMDEALKELVPMLKVRTGGTSEVAGLAVVAGLECADASEGDALLVLRRDGCVFLATSQRSWLTGRSSQPSLPRFASRRGGLRFVRTDRFGLLSSYRGVQRPARLRSCAGLSERSFSPQVARSLSRNWQTPFALCIARGSPNTAVSLNLRSFTAGSSTRLGQNSPAKESVAVVDLDGELAAISAAHLRG
jgi:hypothetical protein